MMNGEPASVGHRKSPYHLNAATLGTIYTRRFHTVRTRYVKIIIFVKPCTTTTTIPAATSTTTSLETISSTSTVVPDSVTVTESFSTTSTTTITLTSVLTDTSSSTELVNATTTTTSHSACSTDNILLPQLENGWRIWTAGYTEGVAAVKQDVQAIDSAYDCCVSCLLSSDNCQYSVLIHSSDGSLLCGRLSNPAICRAQEFRAGEVILTAADASSEPGLAVINGPCGVLIRYNDGPDPDRPPPAMLLEL
ncbi:MAG: hypothetical protein Q9207_006154 [Kuettlingeria erythrocarpa]